MIKVHNREKAKGRLRRFTEYLSSVGMLRGETLIHSPSIRALETAWKVQSDVATLILQGLVCPEKGKSAVGFYASRNFRSLKNSMRRVNLFLLHFTSFSVILSD